jgi:hypothetical protein
VPVIQQHHPPRQLRSLFCSHHSPPSPMKCHPERSFSRLYR